MWGIFLSEGESSTKIFKLHLVLEFAENSGVDFFLELLSSIRGGALWSGVSEELLGSSFLGFAKSKFNVGCDPQPMKVQQMAF
jgi:hypothetical protein